MSIKHKLIAVIVLSLFAISIHGFSFSAEKTGEKKLLVKSLSITGEVVAVNAKDRLLTVKADGGEVSFTTTASTSVKEGKNKKAITDIKAGNTVTVTYSKKDDKNIAKSILIKLDEKIISKNEALALLKKLASDIQILEIRTSPVKGLWEVDIESHSKKGIIYIDSSKKYMIQGAIIDLRAKANLTQERFNEINKVDISQIPLDNALVMGDKDASKKVIIFTDPECPYCRKLHQEIKKVLEKRKDIAFYIKLFPLVQLHPKAYEKAMAIACEKSLKLLEDSYAGKSLPEAKCKTSEVDENIKLGERLGIRGTPAIILPNGSIISGYKDADSLISLIDKSS
jgi:thiol:disulfide interchange protein DsbC